MTESNKKSQISRWEEGNFILPITQERFIQIARHFYQVAEETFDRPCSMEIKVSKYPADTQTSWDGRDPVDQSYFTTANLNVLNPDIWKNASSITVNVRAASVVSGDYPFFGQMTLDKSVNSRRMKCYLQFEA